MPIVVASGLVRPYHFKDCYDRTYPGPPDFKQGRYRPYKSPIPGINGTHFWGKTYQKGWYTDYVTAEQYRSRRLALGERREMWQCRVCRRFQKEYCFSLLLGLPEIHSEKGSPQVCERCSDTLLGRLRREYQWITRRNEHRRLRDKLNLLKVALLYLREYKIAKKNGVI